MEQWFLEIKFGNTISMHSIVNFVDKTGAPLHFTRTMTELKNIMDDLVNQYTWVLISMDLLCYYFVFFKWANPGLFLFIFVLFKYNIIEKTLGFSRIRTRIVG